MEIQDLNITTTRIQKLFFENPNRSISATFRMLRKKSYLSSFGDYPLISFILRITQDMGISVNKQKFLYAFNQSEELFQLSKKEKTALLKQLVKPSYVQTKYTKNLFKSQQIQKMMNYSSL